MQIMSDQNRGQIFLFVQPSNVFLKSQSQQVIDCGKRFIQKQNIGTSGESPGQDNRICIPPDSSDGRLSASAAVSPTCSNNSSHSVSDNCLEPASGQVHAELQVVSRCPPGKKCRVLNTKTDSTGGLRRGRVSNQFPPVGISKPPASSGEWICRNRTDDDGQEFSVNNIHNRVLANRSFRTINRSSRLRRENAGDGFSEAEEGDGMKIRAK